MQYNEEKINISAYEWKILSYDASWLYKDTRQDLYFLLKDASDLEFLTDGGIFSQFKGA